MKIPKGKIVRKNGFAFKPQMSPHDAKDAPHVLPAYSGTESQIEAKQLKARKALFKRLSKHPFGMKQRASKGIKVPYRKPYFLGTKGRETKAGYQNAKLRSWMFNPSRRGRPREHYYFYPVFVWTIIKPWNPKEERNFRELEPSPTLKRYFTTANIGARASWNVRPAEKYMRDDGEYVITQRLDTYRKYGLDRLKLKRLIKAAEERMQGYAMITGVSGVWRSPKSIEQTERDFRNRFNE